MSQFFTPVRAGAPSLCHRVVIAPLTRMRSTFYGGGGHGHTDYPTLESVG